MSDLPTREEAQTAIDTLFANHVIQPEMVVLLDVVMAYGVGYLHTSEGVNAALGYMERDGILILDTRLQTIADAHQRYMAHIDNDDMDDAMSARRERDALLDALTEENNDGEAFGYERPGSDEVADPR